MGTREAQVMNILYYAHTNYNNCTISTQNRYFISNMFIVPMYIRQYFNEPKCILCYN